MFDPTRGIDVGTKHELYLLMRDFADAGGSILFHSTEIAELVHLCDRVLVLYGGRVAAGARGRRRSTEEAHHARRAGRGGAGCRAWRRERRRAVVARPPPQAAGAGAPSRRCSIACAVFVALFALADAITPGRSAISS